MADEIKKSVLGSVRLDSDVWEAVRAMPESLNVYLRRNLIDQKPGSVKVQESLERVGRKAFDAEYRQRPILDAVAPPAGSKTGKASVETWRRGPRQKGDTKR